MRKEDDSPQAWTLSLKILSLSVIPDLKKTSWVLLHFRSGFCDGHSNQIKTAILQFSYAWFSYSKTHDKNRTKRICQMIEVKNWELSVPHFLVYLISFSRKVEISDSVFKQTGQMRKYPINWKTLVRIKAPDITPYCLFAKNKLSCKNGLPKYTINPTETVSLLFFDENDLDFSRYFLLKIDHFFWTSCSTVELLEIIISFRNV